jgi:hypothetical protein
MANNRIFYAVQQVGLKADGDAGAFDAIHGAQSAGMTTNFNLQQVFELGQLEIFENIEQIPDVQVTLSKVLDGYPLMWHLATQAATAPTLVGRSAAKAIFGLAIFPDTNSAAEGTPPSVVQCSGMFVSSLSYTFPVDGSATEEITLVGNDKVWKNTPDHGDELNPDLPVPSFDGQFDSSDPDSPIGYGGISQRENFMFDYDSSDGLDVNGMVADPDTTILPPEIHGISDSGTNEKEDGQNFGAHVQSITVSTDLGRDPINELGRKAPYTRTAQFPTEVTCEIQVISTSGDLISATEAGIYTTGTNQCDEFGNLKHRTIRIAVCEGTRIYLGTKNKLSSVNYGGGDAGGGNVTCTYTFSNFNIMTVVHSGDPHASGATWWTNRDDYLVTLPD